MAGSCRLSDRKVNGAGVLALRELAQHSVRRPREQTDATKWHRVKDKHGPCASGRIPHRKAL